MVVQLEEVEVSGVSIVHSSQLVKGNFGGRISVEIGDPVRELSLVCTACIIPFEGSFAFSQMYFKGLRK